MVLAFVVDFAASDPFSIVPMQKFTTISLASVEWLESLKHWQHVDRQAPAGCQSFREYPFVYLEQ